MLLQCRIKTNMAMCSKAGILNILGKSLLKSAQFGLDKRSIHRYVAPVIKQINQRLEKQGSWPIDVTKRSNFVEWNYNAEIYAFGKRLGEEFQIELLTQAFVHRSYIVQEELKQEEVGIENPNLSLNDNESLAQEGEAIISSYVLSYLTTSLPKLPLEWIKALQDYLISDELLGHVSKNLGTTEIIFSADYPVETPTYAKTLKAIVGALARSQGKERAQLFVRDFICTTLAEKDLDEFYTVSEPLIALKNILERDGRAPPEPRLIGQSAMNDILANYTVGIYSDKQLIGQGPGESIDIAVGSAATDALKRLFKVTAASVPLSFNVGPLDVPVKNLRLSEWRESAFKSS